MSDLGHRTEFYYDFYADNRKVHKLQKYFYVDAALTGTSANWSGRRHESALPTIASAYTNATASRGDRVVVSPFHTETTTAVMTLSKIGVEIEGQKVGNQYPVITLNGAVDMFSFTAVAQKISGLRCTIVTTDAATALFNFAAARCVVDDCILSPSATDVNVVDVFTLATGGDDAIISNIKCHNTTVAVNSFINIEAAVARLELANSYFYGDVATAGIIDAAVVATFIHFHDTTVGTIGSTIPAVTLDGNPTGVVERFTTLGTHTTIATNANWGNLLRLSNLWMLEATDASVQATNIIPALDTD